MIRESPDNRSLWRHLNNLLKPADTKQIPLEASTMANFFTNKVQLIRSITANAPPPTIGMRQVPSFSDIDLYTADEVLHFISRAPTKHCCLDPVPTSIVKQCCDILAPVIAAMANKSFESGEFPETCQHAVVKPLLKKPNLDPFLPQSYRPISNLSFVSKLVEKLFLHRLNKHINQNKLLPTHQSAYRKYHSTETAVAIVVDDIRRAIDKGEVCALVLLDMSAAFDTVDHTVLIEVLQKRYGVKSTALSWMTSYLSRRTQSVNVGADYSDESSLTCGVPQGSVLGPSEYTMYAEEIDDVVQRDKLRHHMYADDIQILATMRPAIAEVTSKKAVIERCVANINDMCASRRLVTNPDKTEVIWFGTSTNLRRIEGHMAIKLGASDILPSVTVRDLGVVLDTKLDFHAHISRTVSTGFYHLRRIRQLRHILPRALKQRLVSALILSRVDYCNAVLADLPASTLAPLKRLMNAAVRFVADLRPRSSVTAAFRELHWLPVDQRITFKLCTLMYGVVHDRAPVYLTDAVTPVSSLPARSHLRSAASGLFDVPRTNTVHGRRAFSVAAPAAWNSLPQNIRNIETPQAFRRHLKAHLFEIAYS